MTRRWLRRCSPAVAVAILTIAGLLILFGGHVRTAAATSPTLHPGRPWSTLFSPALAHIRTRRFLVMWCSDLILNRLVREVDVAQQPLEAVVHQPPHPLVSQVRPENEPLTKTLRAPQSLSTGLRLPAGQRGACAVAHVAPYPVLGLAVGTQCDTMWWILRFEKSVVQARPKHRQSLAANNASRCSSTTGASAAALPWHRLSLSLVTRSERRADECEWQFPGHWGHLRRWPPVPIFQPESVSPAPRRKLHRTSQYFAPLWVTRHHVYKRD